MTSYNCAFDSAHNAPFGQCAFRASYWPCYVGLECGNVRIPLCSSHYKRWEYDPFYITDRVAHSKMELWTKDGRKEWKGTRNG